MFLVNCSWLTTSIKFEQSAFVVNFFGQLLQSTIVVDHSNQLLNRIFEYFKNSPCPKIWTVKSCRLKDLMTRFLDIFICFSFAGDPWANCQIHPSPKWQFWVQCHVAITRCDVANMNMKRPVPRGLGCSLNGHIGPPNYVDYWEYNNDHVLSTLFDMFKRKSLWYLFFEPTYPHTSQIHVSN